MSQRAGLVALLVLFTAQESRENELQVPSTLRRLLTQDPSGVCDRDCYVEIDGERHYFPGQFIDRKKPCKEYICNLETGEVDEQEITCTSKPCQGGKQPVYWPGECCPRCPGQDEPTPGPTPWSEWSRCSATCGVGVHIRSRTCNIPPNSADVGVCNGLTLREDETCDTDTPCPQHCEWEYERCDPCSATCGFATRICYPRVTVPARFGGRDCPPFAKNEVPQTIMCSDLPLCEPQDCKWEYRNCGDCSATCGTGNRQCTPHITRQAKHGGEECPDFVKSGTPQTLPCELPMCPAKCLDDEHVCIVKGVEVCVSDKLDPDEKCDCIVTEPNRLKRKRMDWDLDFIHDKCDNCRYTVNPEQEDRDSDGIGDRCDFCYNIPNRPPVDKDHDGIPDACDSTINIPLYYQLPPSDGAMKRMH